MGGLLRERHFAYDTSLFTVVQYPISAANDMNHDLKLIRQWAHDWRMAFNPDLQNQAVELTFSRGKFVVDHPNIFFNKTPFTKVKEHKHLGIMFESNLPFSARIKLAISKPRKGMGLLTCLSRYLPWRILSELYKLYVRPHLDYGDVIYHLPVKLCEFSGNVILPGLMEKLESVQYLAARAITGTWIGTSQEKLYAELVWEALRCRKCSTRLTCFIR